MSARVMEGASANRPVRVLTGVVVGTLVAMLMVLGALPASAHETRVVGDYRLTVGWINEPAYAGLPNAVDLRVRYDEDEEPVEDIDSLEVEITYGDETLTQGFRPRFGEPGAYRSDLVPTRPGTWEFRLFGEIEGTEIDETFVSGPETFNDIQEMAAVSFPEADPSNAELAELMERELGRMEEQLATVDTEHDEMTGDDPEAAGAETAAGDSSDGFARAAAVVAVVLGAAGVLLGLRRRPA